jgi:hypothetical protein
MVRALEWMWIETNGYAGYNSCSTAIEDGQGVNSGDAIGSPDLLHSAEARPLALDSRIARSILAGRSTSAVFTIQSGMPLVVSGVNAGAMTGAVNQIPGVSLTLPSSVQHWYNGTTTVALPC